MMHDLLTASSNDEDESWCNSWLQSKLEENADGHSARNGNLICSEQRYMFTYKQIWKMANINWNIIITIRNKNETNF